MMTKKWLQHQKLFALCRLLGTAHTLTGSAPNNIHKNIMKENISCNWEVSREHRMVYRRPHAMRNWRILANDGREGTGEKTPSTMIMKNKYRTTSTTITDDDIAVVVKMRWNRCAQANDIDLAMPASKSSWQLHWISNSILMVFFLLHHLLLPCHQVQLFSSSFLPLWLRNSSRRVFHLFFAFCTTLFELLAYLSRSGTVRPECNSSRNSFPPIFAVYRFPLVSIHFLRIHISPTSSRNSAHVLINSN